MAVDVNLTNTGSGFNRVPLNTNFENIEAALQDALSRSGNGPNQMEADIDLNGNDLLNVGEIDVEVLTVGGTSFVPGDVTAVGPPGADGADGDDATVTVGTVTTGAAGTNVIITNVGTANDAILDFTIPRGDTGASGAGTGDMIAAQNLNDVASKPTAFANIKQAATTSATGVVELATTAEASTGTDTTRAVTPAGLTQFFNDHPSAGSVKTTYNSSVTWNKPSTGNMAFIQVWGAGGSGGRTSGGGGRAGGGGGGEYKELTVPLAFLPASLSITIGAGGAAKTTNGNGNTGGDTSFGTVLVAEGGLAGGGTNNTSTNPGGAGGGDDGGAGGNSPGVNGGSSTYGGGGGGGGSASDKGGNGGSSTYGGGGGAGYGDNGLGEGSGNIGVSTYGGSGGLAGNANTGASATAGSVPGGGGGAGGTAGDTFSGAGAAGRCIVTVY
jgi:hypothetical protein